MKAGYIHVSAPSLMVASRSTDVKVDHGIIDVLVLVYAAMSTGWEPSVWKKAVDSEPSDVFKLAAADATKRQ